MEQEAFFSGYCRQLDASRMVAAFAVDGQLEEVDCRYGNCPYQADCQVAKKIDAFLDEL